MLTTHHCTNTARNEHVGCSIIPPYMVEKIRDHSNDQAIRDIAHEMLEKHAEVRHSRYRTQKQFHKSGMRPAATSEASVIRIYDAQNKTRLPGSYISNPNESKDRDILNTYNWAKKTDELFRKIFSRNSIDDQEMDIVSTVHYDRNYSNAFWNGSQLAFGDGDGTYFTSFTIDSDIYAHEVTHGVTQFDVNLAYRNQSGALNESLSDVFGIMTKQYIFNQDVETSNWLIGEEVMVGEEYALRSMKAPGTGYKNHPAFGNDPQPASMDNYNDTTSDNGGVHINSGIPNRAFYLTALKLKQYDPDRYAYSWTGAGRIWYEARYGLSKEATFTDFVKRTVDTAQTLYGKESQEEKAVRYAWAEVKLAPEPGEGDNSDAPKCPDTCTIF